MRGKVNALLQSVVTFGITPAYAGKSYNAAADTYHPQDHPRLCGEKQIPVVHFTPYYWITPAYAGKRK